MTVFDEKSCVINERFPSWIRPGGLKADVKLLKINIREIIHRHWLRYQQMVTGGEDLTC